MKLSHYKDVIFKICDFRTRKQILPKNNCSIFIKMYRCLRPSMFEVCL